MTNHTAAVRAVASVAAELLCGRRWAWHVAQRRTQPAREGQQRPASINRLPRASQSRSSRSWACSWTCHATCCSRRWRPAKTAGRSIPPTRIEWMEDAPARPDQPTGFALVARPAPRAPVKVKGISTRGNAPTCVNQHRVPEHRQVMRAIQPRCPARSHASGFFLGVSVNVETGDPA